MQSQLTASDRQAQPGLDLALRAANDKVMELVTHVIGNYSFQDLCSAGHMLRRAAISHSREVRCPTRPHVATGSTVLQHVDDSKHQDGGMGTCMPA